MSHTFISYVEEDSGIAQEMACGLEEAGYPVWYYERDGSAPGAHYTERIFEAIQLSEVVILVLSPQSLASRHIDAEIICAFESSKPFIPLRSGLTHEEIQQQRPGWRLPLGGAVSIAVPTDGASAILPQIIRGLESLKVQRACGETPISSDKSLAVGVDAAIGKVRDTGSTTGTTQQKADASVTQQAGSLEHVSILIKVREAARTDVLKFSVFWWQWILASFIVGRESVTRGFLFNVLVPPAVLAASFFAHLVSDDLLVGGIAGSLIAGTLGGMVGYFAAVKDAYGAVFGLAFGLINGAYLLGMFTKERRCMSLFRAGLITLTTVASLFSYLTVWATYRASWDIIISGIGDGLWKGLSGSTLAVLLGGLILLTLKHHSH